MLHTLYTSSQVAKLFNPFEYSTTIAIINYTHHQPIENIRTFTQFSPLSHANLVFFGSREFSLRTTRKKGRGKEKKESLELSRYLPVTLLTATRQRTSIIIYNSYYHSSYQINSYNQY